MSNAIKRFTGEFEFLSNFYPSWVRLDGIVYWTVEHAFQASKTLASELRKPFAMNMGTTPARAKRMGRALELRTDWEQVKIGIMHNLLRQKFTTGTLRNKLIATGDMELVEGNTWGDTYWGVCKGVGENHLGKLLMLVRDEIAGKGGLP
jgi:N-glycosidase YbiA